MILPIAMCAAFIPALELMLEAREASAARASSTMIRVGRANVRYRLTGSDSGKPLVVLLNGFGSSIEQWRLVTPFLTTEFRVLAYDGGGMGFSDAPDNSLRAQAAELLGLLNALGERKPILLVAYSQSASLARLFAAEHPERLTGMVLLAPYFPEIESLRLPGRHTGLRAQGRLLATSFAGSLFGLRRLREALEPVRPLDADVRRSQVILRRVWHWRAAFLEIIAEKETARVLAASQRLSRPLVLLEEELSPEASTILVAAVNASTDAVLSRAAEVRRVRLPPIEHSQLLENQRVLGMISEALLSLSP